MPRNPKEFDGEFAKEFARFESVVPDLRAIKKQYDRPIAEATDARDKSEAVCKGMRDEVKELQGKIDAYQDGSIDLTSESYSAIRAKLEWFEVAQRKANATAATNAAAVSKIEGELSRALSQAANGALLEFRQWALYADEWLQHSRANAYK